MNAPGMILTTLMIATIPQQLVSALDMMQSASQLKDMTAQIQAAAQTAGQAMGNPQDIASLCPLMKQLAKGAGPEAAQLIEICDAIQSGQSPDVVMAKAGEAMAMLEAMQRP